MTSVSDSARSVASDMQALAKIRIVDYGSSGDSTHENEDFDAVSAEKVTSVFNEMDDWFYDEDTRYQLADELGDETRAWSKAFTHFRVTGRQLAPDGDTGLQAVPAPAHAPPIAAVDHGLTIVGQKATIQEIDCDEDPGEEVFAIDGDGDEYFAYDADEQGDEADGALPPPPPTPESTPSSESGSRRGLPPTSPRSCIRDAVMAQLFQAAWAELVPVFAPLVAAVINGASPDGAAPPRRSSSVVDFSSLASGRGTPHGGGGGGGGGGGDVQNGMPGEGAVGLRWSEPPPPIRYPSPQPRGYGGPGPPPVPPRTAGGGLRRQSGSSGAGLHGAQRDGSRDPPPGSGGGGLVDSDVRQLLQSRGLRSRQPSQLPLGPQQVAPSDRVPSSPLQPVRTAGTPFRPTTTIPARKRPLPPVKRHSPHAEEVAAAARSVTSHHPRDRTRPQWAASGKRNHGTPSGLREDVSPVRQPLHAVVLGRSYAPAEGSDVSPTRSRVIATPGPGENGKPPPGSAPARETPTGRPLGPIGGPSASPLRPTVPPTRYNSGVGSPTRGRRETIVLDGDDDERRTPLGVGPLRRRPSRLRHVASLRNVGLPE